MAYKDSGELPIGQSYQLGEYAFSITVSQDPGESETGINVRCDKGGERARVASEITGTVQSWRVEANDDTADVYVTVSTITYQPLLDACLKLSPGSTVFFRNAIPSYGETSAFHADQYNPTEKDQYVCLIHKDGVYYGATFCQSEGQIEYWLYSPAYYDKSVFSLSQNATLNNLYAAFDSGRNSSDPSYWNGAYPIIDWEEAINLSNSLGDPFDNLVARFAIDLHDAGGTGTDSDWDDPGDWDEERDPEDPPTTLRLTITGASAGTHGGTPSAPAPQQTYGSGGTGGNGGGGGAGASTVIVYKFATDRADSKEITATARGPGAGSSGGPGGKGGDGCILIFY